MAATLGGSAAVSVGFWSLVSGAATGSADTSAPSAAGLSFATNRPFSRGGRILSNVASMVFSTEAHALIGSLVSTVCDSAMAGETGAASAATTSDINSPG